MARLLTALALLLGAVVAQTAACKGYNCPPPSACDKVGEDCVFEEADIVFIMDSSGSVSNDDYETSLDFVADAVQSFNIAQDKVRVALIEFSSNADLRFDFAEYSDKIPMVADIKSTPKTDGATFTNEALDLARTALLPGSSIDRPGVLQMVIVVTDGRSTNAAATAAAATALHATGAIVVAIGVGPGPDQAELELIASNMDYVFTVDNFDDLVELQESLLQDACQAAQQLMCDKEICEAKCKRGQCEMSGGEVFCVCGAGFTGEFCQDKIRPCDGVNCNKGTCRDYSGEAECHCFYGWTGEYCTLKASYGLIG